MRPESSRDDEGVPPRARLLHITTVPMTLGFFRGQLEHVAAHGFQVHVVSSPGPELDALGRSGVARTQAVPMSRRLTPFRDLGALARLRAEIRRIRPQIVHAHTPKAGLLGMIAAASLRVPVRIYHLRGLPLTTARGPLRPVLLATERLACALAHRVFCVGPSLRDAALEAGICPPHKLVVLARGSSNGVDARGRFDPENAAGLRGSARSRLGIPEAAPVVGFVGRVVRDKGVVELAEAWGRVRERHPEAHLVLVGPLEERDAIPADTLGALRADDRVRITGEVGDPVVFYAAMDVLALPSHREGFPNVPLEAAAMGLPVVATTAVGCVDAVEDGVTGTLVPTADAAALADALDGYLSDPGLRRRHGAAGRARCLARFAPEDVWEAVLDEYRDLLAAVHRGARSEAAATVGQ